MAGLTWIDFPDIALAIATLVLLEGLLSADNALVLAVMVRHLPKDKQKKALRFGIWGAFIFRAISVIFAYQLIRFWQIKLLGGLYLVYLALKHFIVGEAEAGDSSESGKSKRFGDGFWATVINVELADIAFSIDSILAAVAMVEGLSPKLQNNHNLALAIIYIGGVLGIIMMRLVAGFFLILLNKYQGLASGAYLLVAWIGLKLIGGGIHSAFHMKPEVIPGVGPINPAGAVPGPATWQDGVPDWVRELPWDMPDIVFWIGMAGIVIGSLLYRGSAKTHSHVQSPGSETPDSSTDSTG